MNARSIVLPATIIHWAYKVSTTINFHLYRNNNALNCHNRYGAEITFRWFQWSLKNEPACCIECRQQKQKNVPVKMMSMFLPLLTMFWKKEKAWTGIQVIKEIFVICQSSIYNMKKTERESRSERGSFLSLVHLRSLAPASKGESPHFQESIFFNGQFGPGNQWMSSLFWAPPRWTFLSFIFADRGVPNLYLFHSVDARCWDIIVPNIAWTPRFAIQSAN